LNQKVEGFKRHHFKIKLEILNVVTTIFYNFNINISNFNVEVGGQTIISKSATSKTLLAFFEIFIPDPWSSFSVASFKELKGCIPTLHLK
jgi:hypothetical protein